MSNRASEVGGTEEEARGKSHGRLQAEYGFLTCLHAVRVGFKPARTQRSQTKSAPLILDHSPTDDDYDDDIGVKLAGNPRHI